MTIADETPTAAEADALLARARAGDAEAFCRLAQTEELRLYRQALALCADPHTAEDLVAETLVEAWRSVLRFDGSCRFSTWLYAILLHRHLKLVRRNLSRPSLLASLSSEDAEGRTAATARIPDPAPSAFETLDQHERATQLNAALAELPAAHQAVVRLRFYQDASLAEIAAVLGVPLGTVKSRLHHALLRLREEEAVVNLLQAGRDT